MGKIIQFRPRTYAMPDVEIKPQDVTLLTCDYDDSYNPVLILKTTTETFSFCLCHGRRYDKYDLIIDSGLRDAIIDFLDANNLIPKTMLKSIRKFQDDCRFGVFAGNVHGIWNAIRIHNKLLEYGYDYKMDSMYQFTHGSAEKKVLLRFAKEDHFDDFKAFLNDYIKPGNNPFSSTLLFRDNYQTGTMQCVNS